MSRSPDSPNPENLASNKEQEQGGVIKSKKSPYASGLWQRQGSKAK